MLSEKQGLCLTLPSSAGKPDGRFANAEARDQEPGCVADGDVVTYEQKRNVIRPFVCKTNGHHDGRQYASFLDTHARSYNRLFEHI